MRILTIFLAILLSATNGYAQYKKYFEEKSLRLDYYHCGNADSEEFFFDELIQEPFWAGSKTNLIDSKEYGNNMIEVYTADTSKLIYSRGYSTLFGEWQTTSEAKITSTCYPESLIMPFPKEKVVVSIKSRNRNGLWEKKFEYIVDPQSYFIKKESEKLPVFDVVNSGDPAKKVDIVLLPEGYTADQKDIFTADCRKFAEEFFSYSPYSENKKKWLYSMIWLKV